MEGKLLKLAFLFAGQGSQKVGMGKDLYDNNETFRNIIDSLEADFDIKKLMFEGPMEQLSQTRYTQPCMAAFAAGVIGVLNEKGIVPDYVAGLSLGEYSALHAAGVFDAMTDDLELAARILQNIDATQRGKILGAMDPEIAARITKIMEP